MCFNFPRVVFCVVMLQFYDSNCDVARLFPVVTINRCVSCPRVGTRGQFFDHESPTKAGRSDTVLRFNERACRLVLDKRGMLDETTGHSSLRRMSVTRICITTRASLVENSFSRLNLSIYRHYERRNKQIKRLQSL